jgi:hypothetical protein
VSLICKELTSRSVFYGWLKVRPLRVLWWALISVIGLYLAACLVFGTGPLYLASEAVSEIAALLLAGAVLVGAFWAWVFVGRGFFRTAAIIVVAYVLLQSALSTVSAYPFSPLIGDQVSTALTDSQTLPTQPSILIFAYPSSCVLRAGNQSKSQSSGYHVFSYANAQSASMANCNGFGYLQLETFASGIGASSTAESSIWWSTNGINVPRTSSGYSLLSVGLDISINGWQVPSGGSAANSQATLQYVMKLMRDDGNQEYMFGKYFQNAVGFGGDYEPAYNSLLVESGHSYTIVVMFDATSLSKTSVPTTSTKMETCFGFPSLCGPAPDQPGNPGYCPTGVPRSGGNCPYIEWRSASYNITRTNV